MAQPPQTGKRIVSKGKYLVNTGTKTAVSSFGAAIFLIGAGGAAIACCIVLSLLWQHWYYMIVGLPLFFIIGGGSVALLYYGRKIVKEGKAIDAGIPFTSANTANLPESESLVRASDSPQQDYQAVLLRAATPTGETPPEELVRAAVGPQNASRSGTQ